jgi:hypothetical protein
MDGSRIKAGASKFKWRWGKECSFFPSNGKNALRCKRFDKVNSNKKQCEMVLRMCGLILFQFPMGTCLLEMNK